ncbi:type VI secretion system secreted protein VgrG [Yoonia maricola]|uniref:Type VI secretion system secreted protein VgrG n=1 Tax=Yoonia maricola TaxID=420999 RepID=A0A2M8W0A7_9RHOB|nr:type VI secretion system tip protein TssI/VgrG [Yoonia maricola]PJI84360.1 type VI secretion system secreted protein VgrG [Yoonia maricola]
MNTHFSQQYRQGRLTTSLGADTLVLLRMDGTEELSGDFEWRVEALSTQPGLDLHSLLGTHATVEIDHTSGARAFDGVVCEAEACGASENGWRYNLVLRPWLHVAGLRRNMRIFHNKTVVQIVEEVLSAYAYLGNPHLDLRLTEDYPVLEYTTQYGDTDADFVRRQLERHGISWSWAHEDGSHTLLLTDAEFGLPEVPGGTRPFYGVDGFHRHKEEHFRTWAVGERITTGAVRLTEYNFKTPNAAQEVDHTGDATHPSGEIESYDWPGDYLQQDEGREGVRRRTQAERGQAPRHHAQGDVVSLGAGWRVALKGDEVPGATGQTFVCLKAEHRFRAQSYGSGDSGNDEQPYAGSYVLMPTDTPYRPERRTVGPKVQGPETAVVVGEGEIDCDEHGRILCRFHWDLEGAHTMRVRVSQNWASKGWGGMVIPRIGMEVIVEHLRGDPDKPIVTGCVFNGDNTTPYELPKHKTRSTFMTDSHKGVGHNELRFEDESGQEEIYMHAQKDMNIEILNDRSKRVEEDQSEFVGQDKSIQVGGDHSEVISGNMSIAVGSNPLSRALMNKTQVLFSKLGGVMEKVKIPDVLNFAKGNMQIFIEKNKSEIVNVASSEVVGVAKSTVVGQSFQQTVGKAMSTIVRGRWESDVGQVQVMRVGDQITIQVGEKSTLTMSKEGDILLKGKRIKLDADQIDMN